MVQAPSEPRVHRNHFAELQQVVEVRDQTTFGAMGLERKRLVLVVHSGSRGLGESILRSHVRDRADAGLEMGSHALGRYLRQAAKLLGVDRNVTLHELISSGELRTVLANGRMRVPAEELERLIREGFDTKRPSGRRLRPSMPKQRPGDVGAKIRSLKL